MGTVTGGDAGLPHTLRKQGFTLIELLLVISIAGITLGLVSLQFGPDRHTLEAEAQRLASLMQLAGDEAIMRNRPILLEADSRRYQFLIRNGGTWKPIADDELLRARQFPGKPVNLRLTPQSGSGDVRIVFDPRPVGKPFVLTMSTDSASIGIRADGLGRYVVQ